MWILSICKSRKSLKLNKAFFRLYSICERFVSIYTLIKSTKIKYIPIMHICRLIQASIVPVLHEAFFLHCSSFAYLMYGRFCEQANALSDLGLYWSQIIAPDKWGYQKIILFLHENIGCEYSLEVPKWDASNEYHNMYFLWRRRKNIDNFWMKKAPYLELRRMLQCESNLEGLLFE